MAIGAPRRIQRKRAYLPRKRKIRPSSISRLKKNLEALQKQIVIKTYGTDCYTCTQTNLIGANCQLGHVPWPRSILSTPCKFDYHYTRIQCFRCNIHLGGMGAVALRRMQSEGIDTESMWQRNQETKGKKYGRQYFEDKISEYRELLDAA